MRVPLKATVEANVRWDQWYLQSCRYNAFSRKFKKKEFIESEPGILCRAMANAMRRPNCDDPMVESATAIPSGRLWQVSVIAVMTPNLLRRNSDDSSIFSPLLPIKLGPNLLTATTTKKPQQQQAKACDRLRGSARQRDIHRLVVNVQSTAIERVYQLKVMRWISESGVLRWREVLRCGSLRRRLGAHLEGMRHRLTLSKWPHSRRDQPWRPSSSQPPLLQALWQPHPGQHPA